MFSKEDSYLWSLDDLLTAYLLPYWLTDWVTYSCDPLYLQLVLRSQIWGQPRDETPPGQEVLTGSDNTNQRQLLTNEQPEEDKAREENPWGQ